MERYRSWLALKRVTGVGNVLYRRLLDRFKTPDAIFAAGEEALQTVAGVSLDLAKAICCFSAFDQVDREIEKLDALGVTLLSLQDPDYPPLLAAIYDPPPFLYVKGDPQTANPYPVAVVGSRRASHYGKTVAERLSRELAEQGVTIVSGFARGIDTIAHQAALAAGGRTIAVLGCGIDQIYPPEHRSLSEEVAEQGLILSEFPLGTPPDGRNFPQRNRIISGLSLGCLVVEATLESGSLITARCALEQGREVFAIPGSILSETTAGTHQLIRSGAKLVERVEDILEEILPQVRRVPRESAFAPVLEGEEKKLYDLLGFEPKHIDQLIHESTLSIAVVSGLLLALELRGIARQLTGKFYVRI
ncbi:MAG: DNA-processing protein DprA [Candidatus Manganitrophus sp.]|nr:MAG: DNA-processing protein DprA [Candidatus Manganitrophus sp.]